MSVQRVAVREAQWTAEDLRGIWNLCRRLFESYRSVSHDDFVALYRHRWLDNPARNDRHSLGWVLDTPKDGIAGFVGMLPVRMKVEDREIDGVCGTTFVVLPQYRLHSLGLYKRYSDWGNQQLLLDVTSGEIGNKLHRHLKQGIVPIPVEHMDRQLLWPIRPEVPVRWMLDKSRWQKWSPVFDRPAAAWLIRVCAKGWFGSHQRIRFPNANLSVEPVREFTDDFTKLWEDHKHQYGITTVRDRRYLQWRHRDLPPVMSTTHVFACREGGALRGYLCLMERNRGLNYYPGHFRVTDVFFDRHRPEVLESLMNHAYEYARSSDGCLFEVSGFAPAVAVPLLSQRPYIKFRDAWPYWHKTPSSNLADICSHAEWWPSGSDGDANF